MGTKPERNSNKKKNTFHICCMNKKFDCSLMPHSAVEGWWTGGLKARVHENWIMLPLIQHRRCKSFSNKICCPDKSESPLSESKNIKKFNAQLILTTANRISFIVFVFVRLIMNTTSPD